MIPYASRTGTRRNLIALRERGWRLLVSATGVLRTEGFPYALDNGAWSAYQQKKPFDDRAFALALRRLGAGADWTVLPDIVCGGMTSLELSLRWRARVLAECARALIAVQDGMSTDDIAVFLGSRVGIFVGGSTRWKEETIGLWADLGRRHGCWVHVGRVNSVRRIAICTSAGATSFDGSSASRYATTIRSLDSARRQVGLFGLDR
jgi:hypothetical protein